MTARRIAPPVPVLLSMLAAAVFAFGCSSAPPVVGTTFPPPVPTRTVNPEQVIAGLKKELGPKSPIRFKATADAYVNKGALLTVILDGDFQGNEMDGFVKYRLGGLQLSYHVIAADGKAYVRQHTGKWAKSPEKVPSEGSGPFGDMHGAKLEFKGVSKTDRDLYTVVWSNPTHAQRALDGTLFTSPKIKTASMAFLVDERGKPYSATYKLDGTAKVEGKRYSLKIEGYYQFFAIHERLDFESPLKK
jgi:hypothetical protein